MPEATVWFGLIVLDIGIRNLFYISTNILQLFSFFWEMSGEMFYLFRIPQSQPQFQSGRSFWLCLALFYCWGLVTLLKHSQYIPQEPNTNEPNTIRRT